MPSRKASGLRALLSLLPLLILAACASAPLQRDAAQAARDHGLSVSPQEEADDLLLLKALPASPKAPEARYFVAQAAFNRGDYAKAEALFKAGAQRGGSDWSSPCYYMLALCQEKQGHLTEAFEAYSVLAQQATGGADLADQARQAAERLVKERFDLPGLKALATLHATGPQADLIHARMVEESFKAGDLTNFFNDVADHRTRFPGSSLQADLDKLLGQAYRRVPIKPRLLGLMVPGSGRGASYGADVQNGVQLALEEANVGLPEADRFAIQRVDEGMGGTAAASAARKLIEDDKVIGILGPVFSEAAEGASTVAARSRVPLLSPSAPRAGLGEGNPFFFRNCITPQKQARQMADHALLQQRYQRLGVLYPGASPYGLALAQAFERRVSELGGTVAAYVSYTAGGLDFKDAMLALGGADPNVLKEAEVEGRKEQQVGVEKASSGLAESIVASLRALAQAEGASSPKGVPTAEPTPLMRLAVIDFACDSAAANNKAGRAMADRFWRTLGSLSDQGLELKSPSAAFEWLALRHKAPEDLNPQGAAELARGLGAHLVVAGTVAEEPPDWDGMKARLVKGGLAAAKAQREMDRAGRFQVFNVAAQLIDASSGSIVASRAFEFTKLRPQASNIYGLQALYLPAKDLGEITQIAPNLAFYELKLPLLGSDVWHASELLREAENLEGARFTTAFFAGSTRPEVQRFVKAYQDRYAARPNELAAQAYDAATAMLGCLRHGVSTREDLRDALASLRGFPGVSGETSFDTNQDAVKKLPILEVKGGEFIQVQ